MNTVLAGRAPLLKNVSFLLKIAVLPTFPHPTPPYCTFSRSGYAVSSSSAYKLPKANKLLQFICIKGESRNFFWISQVFITNIFPLSSFQSLLSMLDLFMVSLTSSTAFKPVAFSEECFCCTFFKSKNLLLQKLLPKAVFCNKLQRKPNSTRYFSKDHKSCILSKREDKGKKKEKKRVGKTPNTPLSNSMHE